MNKIKVMIVSIVISTVILLIVVLGLSGKIKMDFRKEKANITEKVTENKVTIDIKYTNSRLDLGSVISKFNANQEYEGKLLDLTVTGIIIDKKEHTFKLENHPQDCLKIIDSYSNTHNNFYIDKTKFLHQGSDACYISSLDSISVINEKYIAVAFRGEGNIYIYIYDEKGKEIDSIDDIIDFKIDNDSIKYRNYDNEKGCFINTYTYNIENGKSTKKLESQEKNTKCDAFRETGCNCK